MAADLTERTISRIQRLTNSVNGNPRFKFFFDDASTANLQSDASFGYEVGNPGFREGDKVMVAFSRHGTVRFMRKSEANDGD